MFGTQVPPLAPARTKMYGAWRRLRAEQAPEGKIVPQGLLHMADVRIDLPQTVLDFLVRMMLAVKGVQFHFGFEIL